MVNQKQQRSTKTTIARKKATKVSASISAVRIFKTLVTSAALTFAAEEPPDEQRAAAPT